MKAQTQKLWRTSTGVADMLVILGTAAITWLCFFLEKPDLKKKKSQL